MWYLQLNHLRLIGILPLKEGFKDCENILYSMFYLATSFCLPEIGKIPIAISILVSCIRFGFGILHLRENK
ncbi:hypothetical protein [Lysinibacillus sp. NPDC056232]|uniref:hypothetical protein n=1 Tax=Lysinibacillus sp. NPDC056232 TaxID=3345756 RepID=UPI0035DC206B